MRRDAAVLVWIGLLSWSTSCRTGSSLDSGPRTATIDYRVRYQKNEGHPDLQVTIKIRGLDPESSNVTLSLEDWGEWSDLDAYYLCALQGVPPLAPCEGSPAEFALDLPERWDGSAQVSYRIPLVPHGSRVQQSHGLLPWQGPTYARWFTVNTLMRVLVDGEPLIAHRTIEFAAPSSMPIATGLGGVSHGRQVVTMGHDIDNALVYVGEVGAHCRSQAGDLVFEVAQLGGGANINEEVLHWVEKYVGSCGRTTGRTLSEPVRLFLVDEGGGGVRTDHGQEVAIGKDGPRIARSPYFKQTVAHELFHNWIGGFLQAPDESTIWFSEGFTDYLSLWHMASIGEVSRDWFAERMMEIDEEARRESSLGKIAFADPDVDWRDGDGPNETMAYKGGASLAFVLDVELREGGKTGLVQMIRDLMAKGGEYDLGSLCQWMESQGLGDFCAHHVRGREIPDVRAALLEAGFVEGRIEVPLTYLGIATDSEQLICKVTDLDPQGPAANAGLKVGDQIAGYFPSRDGRPEVAESVTTPYRFLLNGLEPSVTGWYLDVTRGDQALQIRLNPEIIPGGYVPGYRAGGGKLDAFFDFRP